MTAANTNRSVRTEQLPTDDPGQPLACRQCGAARADGERFCEACGHDHETHSTWSLEVSVDRKQHERTASGLTFPAGRIASILVFECDEVVVGRRKEDRNVNPDVDLSLDLADPGASHMHVAIRRDAGSAMLTVVDLGSTNGTTLNDDEQPIEPHQPVRLSVGDLIHVGAWTTIRIMV